MAKSARDLCNKALELLMVSEPGQPISAEDYSLVRAALSTLVAELDAIEVAYIYIDANDDAAEDVDERYFMALARLLANDAAPSFGIATADEASRQVMLNRLRRVVAVGPQGDTQTAEYF
jgi:hypothetical protein